MSVPVKSLREVPLLSAPRRPKRARRLTLALSMPMSLALSMPLALSLAGAAGGLLAPATAHAYEPATTLAGLTEQAALASRLHRRLMERFGCSLGLFEPLRLELGALPESAGQALFVRFSGLDPAEGYAPELTALTPGRRLPAARAHVLGWLGAGTVSENLPAIRERHHFFQPATGAGLTRPPDQSALYASLQSVTAGLSSVRALMAGAALDGTGRPAPDWVAAEDNDLGLAVFQRAYAQAVSAEKPAERESALAQALLATGAMLSVLEQAGDPAHVRNDLAAALDGGYARFVAQRYGRAAMPAPGPAPADAAALQHLRDFWADGQGHGLAERTARSFYSLNTLPGQLGGELPTVAGLTRAPSLSESESELPVPSGWPAAPLGYLGSARTPHLLAWQRGRNTEGTPILRFHLDDRTHDAYATALLPEIGRYAQLFLDFLFRGELRLELHAISETDPAQELRIMVGELPLGSGEIELFGDVGEGTRRRLLPQPQKVVPTRTGAALATIRLADLPLQAPEGAVNRIVVLFRGRDRQNEPIVTSAQLVMPHERASEEKAPELKAPEEKTESK